MPIRAALTDLAYGVWGPQVTDSDFRGFKFDTVTDLKLFGINLVTYSESMKGVTSGGR